MDVRVATEACLGSDPSMGSRPPRAPRALESVRLNLGCGRRARPGWINVDYLPGPAVDLLLDLNEFPYPFADGTVDEIYASHILEHLADPYGALLEWHRVLKDWGTLEIIVPHRRSTGAYHLEHRSFFDEDSLHVVTAGDTSSLETRQLFRVLTRETHYGILLERVAYHLHERFPWTRRLPLGRVRELRWVLAKVPEGRSMVGPYARAGQGLPRGHPRAPTNSRGKPAPPR